MITLNTLSALYPVGNIRQNPGCVSKALTGWIPMEYFEVHEADILAARKATGKRTRVVFRGPRPSKGSQDTPRYLATHAVIYERQPELSQIA